MNYQRAVTREAVRDADDNTRGEADDGKQPDDTIDFPLQSRPADLDPVQRRANLPKFRRAAGGVHHGVVAQQDHRVDAAFGHRRAQAGPGLAAHAGEVRRIGNQQRWTGAGARVRERRHYRPRNVVMFPLTMRAAFSGPTASTTAASDFSE